MLENGECFAQGACKFSTTLSTQRDTLERIAFFIQVGSQLTEAAVDTGGAYLFCNHQLAEALELDPADALLTEELRVRGRRIPGALHRVFLNLIPDQGEGLQIDVTAFVPLAGSRGEIDMPVYLGFRGCLEWLRFAVDPVAGIFYFGRGDEEG